jgi:ankyrin repeat protein
VDAGNIIGSTPLHEAAFNGHKEAAICLLDHRADINAKRDSLLSPVLLKKAISLLSISLSSVGLISIWPTTREPNL